MGTVTNVSRRLIHIGDIMLVPGVPNDQLSDEMMDNRVVQQYFEAGDIKEGAVKVKAEVPQDEDDADEADRKPAARTQQATTKPAQQQAPAGGHKPAAGKE